MLMDIIAWIIIGGLAGWVASLIMKTDSQMGVPANIIVGIIGALIGGFVMRMLSGESPDAFSISGFIMAVLGAVILLGILKLMSGSRKNVQP